MSRINREIILNAISLGMGFFGNFCLLLNFTRRIRYIIALPATIISWYFATGIVSAESSLLLNPS
jgi:potassium channel subfamily K